MQKPETEQAEFLERECGGDSELRRRVDALIAAHELSGSFLDSPPKDLAGTSPTVAQSMPEQSGSLIGPYKLLQQIGEGGMGAVYMAEQIEPVHEFGVDSYALQIRPPHGFVEEPQQAHARLVVHPHKTVESRG